MRAFRIWFKSQKISTRSWVMAEILSGRSSQLSDLWDRRHLKFSNSAITRERIEIFWLLDQILKALIEADRMVPLLRVYDVVLNFRFSTKKKRTEKKNVHYVCFFSGSIGMGGGETTTFRGGQFYPKNMVKIWVISKGSGGFLTTFLLKSKHKRP